MPEPSRLESLFYTALEKAPADRPAFLDRECAGDAELRRLVERLLAAVPAVDRFLESPAGAPAHPTADFEPSPAVEAHPPTATFGDPAETADHPGRDEATGVLVAGRYKLLEEIGEGGMGSVWMAQQTEPVKRTVAVKLIKAGMDSKAVLARFEAERQALALMDHPNIAKVLDAGATSDGRPFFVMELVKGVPITKYCDQKRLTPQQRLELFVPVCQAIQHAHQKGVIHRDIKPSNVLVALYDDRPVPKVIDFGVAKAAGQTLTEKTLATGFGAVVGTPEYMSPEQASFNNLDIDTRSDVYALGVLLYELLAGSPPFSKKELEKVGLLEIFRVIREQEPPKPSTKLSTADALPTLSANRGTEPTKLKRLLRGELDWIVMKALEKDRSRRYETANGFAADVQRYLAGEQVQAVPPSAGYRLRKFLRRNKGPVTAAAVVLLALLTGVAGTTVGLIRADQALQAEAEQRRQVEEREKLLGEQKAQLEGQKTLLEGQKTQLEERTKEAEAARTETDLQLHDNQRGALSEAWQAVETGRMRAILDQMRPRPGRPDLRGFEAHYLDRLTHPQVGVATFKVREPAAARELFTTGTNPSPRVRVTLTLAPNHHYFSIDALDLSTGKPPAGFTPIRGRFGSHQIFDPFAYVVPGTPARIFASAHLIPDFTLVGTSAPPEGELTAWDFRTGRLIARCERLYPDRELIAQGWQQRFLGGTVQLGETCDRKTSRVMTVLTRDLPAEGGRPAATESRVQVHDMATGRVVLLLGAKPGTVQRALYSFDDRYIVTEHAAPGGKSVCTAWDATDGRELWSRQEEFRGFALDGHYAAFDQPNADPVQPVQKKWIGLATGESAPYPQGVMSFFHPPMPDDPVRDFERGPSDRFERLFGTPAEGTPSTPYRWLNDREGLVTVSSHSQGFGPPDAQSRETTFVATTHRPARLGVFPFQAPGGGSTHFERSGRGLQLVATGNVRHPFIAELEFTTRSVLDMETGASTTLVLPPPPPTDESTSHVHTNLFWSDLKVAGNTVLRSVVAAQVLRAPELDTVTHIPVFAVYDLRSGRERFVRTVPATMGQNRGRALPGGVSLGPDGKFVAVTDPVKKELQVLDAESGAQLWRVAATRLPWFLGDGSQLVRFDEMSGALRVYDTATGDLRREVERVVPKPTGAEVIQLSPDRRFLIVMAESQLVVIDTGEWVVRLTLPLIGADLGLANPRFTPDGRTLIVRVAAGRFAVIDTDTWTIRHRIGEPAAGNQKYISLLFREITQTSNRFFLARTSSELSSNQVMTFEVWDLQTGKPWSQFELRTSHDNPVSQCLFTEDGSRMFALCNGAVHVVDLRRNREVFSSWRTGVQGAQPQSPPPHPPSHMELSPDGRELTVYTYDPRRRFARKEVLDARPLGEQELARAREIAETSARIVPPVSEGVSGPKKPETASDYFDLARRLMGVDPMAPAQADPKAAAAAFREAIARDPDFFALYAGLARALAQAGDQEGAVGAYREAVRRCPVNVASWFEIALILERRGDLTGAAEAHRQALRHDERNGVADAWQGMFGGQGGDPPTRASMHREFGNLLIKLDDPAAAEKQYREALRHEPATTWYRRQLILCLHRQGKRAEAGVVADELLKTAEEAERKAQPKPNLVAARAAATLEIGGAYLWSFAAPHAETAEWNERATRLYTELHKTQPPAPGVQNPLRHTHWNRSVALHWDGRSAEALAELDLAMKYTPGADNPEHQMFRTRYVAKSGEHKAAAARIAELRKTPAAGDEERWFYWNGALGYAQCALAAKEDAKLRADYEQKAIDLLRMAVVAGVDYEPFIRIDPDLLPVSERQDFKKLVAELREKFLGPREVAPPPRVVG